MNKAALDAAFWTYCKATGLNPESHPVVEEAIRQAINAYIEHANKHSKPVSPPRCPYCEMPLLFSENGKHYCDCIKSTKIIL